MEAPGQIRMGRGGPGPPGGSGGGATEKASATPSGGSNTRQPLLKAVEEVLPDYVLRMQLGAGSFGRVFLMEHRASGERVAVKTLKKERIVELGMQDKVLREIRILLRLRHPHVIRLHHVFETPKYILLVMEYAENGELFDYITQRGRLTEAEARRIFQQIVGAVEYCHSRMVVHRDLKPENILLDSLWRVKLADFGLGNCMREGHFLRTSCGSPNYAAPEVISGRLYCGPEVDVWGCGVVLFTLLCGRLPFDEKSHVALYQKIKAGAYSRPSHVTPAVQDLLARMLVVDPLQRISIPEIRAHPWFLPWFLPTQLLQYQKEEEERRQRQHQPGAPQDSGPRTTVQVNASSIANLHALRVLRPAQVDKAEPDSMAEGDESALDYLRDGPGAAHLDAAAAAAGEVEVACLVETGQALPWMEDGQLRQRLKGRLAWLPGLPVAARQPSATMHFSLWDGYASYGSSRSGAGSGSSGGNMGKAAWEAMATVCLALQRLGIQWKKITPYALSCRTSPMHCAALLPWAPQATAAVGPDGVCAASAMHAGGASASLPSLESAIGKGRNGIPYGSNGTYHGTHGMQGHGPLNGTTVGPAGGPHAAMLPAMVPLAMGPVDTQSEQTVRAGNLALGSLTAMSGTLGMMGHAHMSALSALEKAGPTSSMPDIARVAMETDSVAMGHARAGGHLGTGFQFRVHFELQLYLDAGTRTCWLDLCLTQGAPMAFLDLTTRFWGALSTCLEEKDVETSRGSSLSTATDDASINLVWQ